jgi:hypothetical protein
VEVSLIQFQGTKYGSAVGFKRILIVVNLYFERCQLIQPFSRIFHFRSTIWAEVFEMVLMASSCFAGFTVF